MLIGITLVSLQTENERLCQPDKIYSVPPPLSVPPRVQQPHRRHRLPPGQPVQAVPCPS